MIIVRLASGDFEFSESALFWPQVVFREKDKYKWRATITLDDEKVYLEAESFYQDRLPLVWHEVNGDLFKEIERAKIFAETD